MPTNENPTGSARNSLGLEKVKWSIGENRDALEILVGTIGMGLSMGNPNGREPQNKGAPHPLNRKSSFMNGQSPNHPPQTLGLLSRLKAFIKFPANRLRQLVRESVRQEIQEHLIPRLDNQANYQRDLSGRFAIPVGPNELMMACPSGLVLVPADDIAVIACFANGGDLEPGTRILVSKALTPGNTFVDVGANLGIMTLAAARAVGPQGKIIAFEPFGQTKRLLERTVWANGLGEIVTIHQAAVSDHAGTHEFYVGPTCGHNSLFPLETSNSPDGGVPKAGNRVEVKLVRLDEVISIATPVHLLKIDAEGAELEVLESASKIIRAQPEIGLIVEFGPSHLKRRGLTTRDWLKPFLDLGLNYMAIDPITGELVSTNPEKLDGVHSENLFFARPQSTIWNRMVGKQPL